jgi:hypothetical protein
MDLRATLAWASEEISTRFEAYRRLLRGACLIVGPCFLVIALGFAIHTIVFLRSSIEATGIIVSMDPKYDKGNDSKSYAPIFTFPTEDGQTFTVTSDFASDPPEFTVGQRVTVLYEKNHPIGARIASFWQLWGMSAMFNIFGVTATGTWYLLSRYDRWLERRGLSLRGSIDKDSLPTSGI